MDADRVLGIRVQIADALARRTATASSIAT
jgi:hypothetical protein